LSELPELPVPPCPPPKASKSSDSPPPSNTIPVLFGYPTKFLPVPYYSSPLSFQILLQSVIPAARTPRTLTIRVPIPFSKPPRRRFKDPSSSNGPMEIDETSDLSQTSSDPTAMDNFGRSSRDVMSEYHSHPQKLSSPKRQTKEEIVSFQTDGLLLYVSQASYQSVRPNSLETKQFLNYPIAGRIAIDLLGSSASIQRGSTRACPNCWPIHVCPPP